MVSDKAWALSTGKILSSPFFLYSFNKCCGSSRGEGDATYTNVTLGKRIMSKHWGKLCVVFFLNVIRNGMHSLFFPLIPHRCILPFSAVCFRQKEHKSMCLQKETKTEKKKKTKPKHYASAEMFHS